MKTTPAVLPPSRPEVKETLEGIHLKLEWNAVANPTPVTYNVYRLDSIRGNVLLSVRQKGTSYATTLALPALRHSRYVVTTVDAYGNESEGGCSPHPNISESL